MIVLVHGAGGNELVYADLLAALRHDARALSLPGRLGSPGPPLTSVEAMADWVLERSPRVVVGHSLGGAIAIEAALRAELDALVLIATGARLRVHPTISSMMEKAVADGVPAELGGVAWRPDAPADLVARFAASARRTPPESALADWRAANAFDRMEDLGRIECPVLVIGGTEDALTPEKYLRYLEAQLPHARLHMIEQAGHMLPYERASEVAALIDEFVGSMIA